jgi:tetratricopeptide (TPR) repeat protein
MSTRHREVTKHYPSVSATSGGVTAEQARRRHEALAGAAGDALEEKQRSFMEVEKDIAAAQRDIRDLYRSGRHREALEIAERAKTASEAHFGKEHPVAASLLVNVGLLRRCLGELEAAEEAYASALRTYRSTCGDDHPSTATCFVNLTSLYKAMADRAQGMERASRLAEARAHGEEALKRKREAVGEDHPETCVAMYTLAGVMLELDPSDKGRRGSVEMLRSAEATLTRRVGAEHRLTATAANNLGLGLKSLGEHGEALECYGRALEARKALLGPAHDDTLVVMHNIAECRLAAGDEAAAHAVQSEIVALVDARGDGTDPAVPTTETGEVGATVKGPLDGLPQKVEEWTPPRPS